MHMALASVSGVVHAPKILSELKTMQPGRELKKHIFRLT
jgi:hypothetical protein